MKSYEQILENPETEKVICGRFSPIVTMRDLKKLSKGQWLNDVLLNAFSQYLVEKQQHIN